MKMKKAMKMLESGHSSMERVVEIEVIRAKGSDLYTLASSAVESKVMAWESKEAIGCENESGNSPLGRDREFHR
ncbi:hypothetical protein MRB53_000183 [Persea americana]|uniref:Uncharacterized protein n=1 Tax=Persea americana TaxID=3435 RepID=A0ACC2MNF0_PERAE|nr:hypothetical protein MRB53_000183 [Persea americana]